MDYQQHAVPGFVAHRYRRTFRIPHAPADVWEILHRRDTFTNHQFWPYRVEFTGSAVTPYMQEGEENTHHGPGMSFTGIMGKITKPSYRDLHYYYGSYFLTIRWIRPQRLQVWVEDNGAEESSVTMQVDSWVKPWISRSWTFMQGIFWSGFGKWVSKLIRRKQPSDG